MTRDEAIDIETIDEAINNINKIYDDIENRTCINCRYCEFDVEDKQTFCKGFCNELLHPVHLNFGCNMFKG